MPHVMISDVMASHPVYQATYSWGFSMNMLCACFVLGEATVLWRKKMPELSSDIAKFTCLMNGVCAPCLFGVVSFQYKHDLDPFETPFNLDVLMWLLHCSFASVFFLAAAAVAFIYGWRLNPSLAKKNHVHPADRFWRSVAVRGVMVLTAAGVVVRSLHMFHDAHVWAIPLFIVEVGLIELMQIGAFVGTCQDMMMLDAADPMLNLSDLLQ